MRLEKPSQMKIREKLHLGFNFRFLSSLAVCPHKVNRLIHVILQININFLEQVVFDIFILTGGGLSFALGTERSLINFLLTA